MLPSVPGDKGTGVDPRNRGDLRASFRPSLIPLEALRSATIRRVNGDGWPLSVDLRVPDGLVTVKLSGPEKRPWVDYAKVVFVDTEGARSATRVGKTRSFLIIVPQEASAALDAIKASRLATGTPMEKLIREDGHLAPTDPGFNREDAASRIQNLSKGTPKARMAEALRTVDGWTSQIDRQKSALDRIERALDQVIAEEAGTK